MVDLCLPLNMFGRKMGDGNANLKAREHVYFDQALQNLVLLLFEALP